MTDCHNTCVQMNCVTFCWLFSAVPGVSKWRAPAGEIPGWQCSSRHFVQQVSVTKTHNCASGGFTSGITWRVEIALGNVCQKITALCEFHARTINTSRRVPQTVPLIAANYSSIHFWRSSTFEVLTAVLLNIRFFWDVLLCCWLGTARRFGPSSFLQLHVQAAHNADLDVIDTVEKENKFVRNVGNHSPHNSVTSQKTGCRIGCGCHLIKWKRNLMG